MGAMLCVNSKAKDGGDQVALAILGADMKLSWKKFKSLLPQKGWRLATEKEVFEITGGCIPGSVPPFGSAFGVKTVFDKTLAEEVRLNFNCGLRTRSLRLACEDFLKVEKPVVGDFAER